MRFYVFILLVTSVTFLSKVSGQKLFYDSGQFEYDYVTFDFVNANNHIRISPTTQEYLVYIDNKRTRWKNSARTNGITAATSLGLSLVVFNLDIEQDKLPIVAVPLTLVSLTTFVLTVTNTVGFFSANVKRNTAARSFVDKFNGLSATPTKVELRLGITPNGVGFLASF